MKKTFFLGVIFFLGVFVYGQSVIGVWKQVDDNNGEAKSYISIYMRGNKVYGKVTKILNPKNVNNTCDKCKGDKKGQKILGMEIIKGLSRNGESYEGGTILDPDNGKEYSCIIKLETANKLSVRGYIGIPAIGRSQTWYRVQ